MACARFWRCALRRSCLQPRSFSAARAFHAYRSWRHSARLPRSRRKRPAEGRLSLNTATREVLLALPQVGGTLADRILEYRAQYGKFVTVEQLSDVEGIGEGLMQQLRGLVYVEDAYEDSVRY